MIDFDAPICCDCMTMVVVQQFATLYVYQPDKRKVRILNPPETHHYKYCIGANFGGAYISPMRKMAAICDFSFANGPVLTTYILDKHSIHLNKYLQLNFPGCRLIHESCKNKVP